MKLILLDGGPASGKNTLGALLARKLQDHGNKATLLDLDTYVEQLNPTWIWNDKAKEENDQQNARANFAEAIDNYLRQKYIVIAIGERFLTKENIANFIGRLKTSPSVYLYHLSIPFSMRMERLHKRGPHSLIDLAKDQKDRDSNLKWYGYIYKNVNSEEIDAQNLFKLIQDNKGLLDTNMVK
jgi:shikimate kinase